MLIFRVYVGNMDRGENNSGVHGFGHPVRTPEISRVTTMLVKVKTKVLPRVCEAKPTSQNMFFYCTSLLSNSIITIQTSTQISPNFALLITKFREKPTLLADLRSIMIWADTNYPVPGVLVHRPTGLYVMWQLNSRLCKRQEYVFNCYIAVDLE
jgi:hypothetical protein